MSEIKKFQVKKKKIYFWASPLRGSSFEKYYQRDLLNFYLKRGAIGMPIGATLDGALLPEPINHSEIENIPAYIVFDGENDSWALKNLRVFIDFSITFVSVDGKRKIYVMELNPTIKSPLK